MSSQSVPSTNPLSKSGDTEPTTDAEMQDATQDSLNPQTQQSGAANDRSSTVDNDNDGDMNLDNAEPPSTQTQTQPEPIPSRKDVTLREFISKMDDYAPIIPDAVTSHYLTLAGLPPPNPADPIGVNTGCTPLPLARLLALATQKFVADLAADAYQYSRIRAGNSAAASNALGGAMGPPQPPVAGGGAQAGKGSAAQQSTLGVQRAGFGGGGQGRGQGSGQGKSVLTMEDLGMAVQEYGINVRRGEFYR